MIRLNKGMATAGSFTVTVQMCRLATEKNEDVCIELFGRDCIAHPGDDPHVRYREFAPHYYKDGA